MACLSIYYRCVNISSFYNTIFFETSSLNVLIVNALDVSYIHSFKVSSQNTKFGKLVLYLSYTTFSITKESIVLLWSFPCYSQQNDECKQQTWYSIEHTRQFAKFISLTLAFTTEYARIFHHIENLPLQHNQTHPFLNFTHKHPHNSTLKPTTLFIYVPLCPNLIFAIISLELSTIFGKISFLSLAIFLFVFVYAIFQTLSKPFQAPCD